MKYAWRWIGAQRLNERSVREYAAVVGAELSAQHLSCTEFHDESKIEHTGADAQVGKILHPSIRFLGHGRVVHAVLRTAHVLKQSVGVEMVVWRVNLWLASVAGIFFLRAHGMHAAQAADAPCLVFAPA